MNQLPSKFEYDIAFSFHSKDEGLANRLNDKVQDRFKTFLYSEHQKELAGKDGEETFNKIFGEKSRVVVVLYRTEWGETPFTRIEQTAIRNRAFGEGFDFTLFIPTESPPSVPKWLPKPRLYLGLERFGLDGAAGVIEARVEEMGGEPSTESARDRAARLQRTMDLDRLRMQFQNSEQGVQLATSAYNALVDDVKAEIAQIGNAHSSIRIKLRSVQDVELISGLGPFMTIYWQCRYSNTLDGAALTVEIHTSAPMLPGIIPSHEPPQKLKTLEFTFERVAADRTAFIEKATKREFQSHPLATYLLSLYMDYAEKRKRRN